MTVVIFLSAFGTLAVSFWPFMIPFAITIDQAASPPSTLRFMFSLGSGTLRHAVDTDLTPQACIECFVGKWSMRKPISNAPGAARPSWRADGKSNDAALYRAPH